MTPSFQQGRFIDRTIRSVIGQDYPSLEYIIQDGGSRDQTTEILSRYDRSCLRWTSVPDGGQAAALNAGFAQTTGSIMAYLNSDDLLLPGSLAAVATYFLSRPDVDVVYGHRIIIDEDDMEIGRWILPRHDPAVLKWMDWVPQETMFWRRRAWDAVGGAVDPAFSFALDWDLLLRFQDAGLVVECLDRFLGAFRLHAEQKTSSKMADQGLPEMALLRRRTFGYDVGDADIQNATGLYLLKHIGADLKWRCGISDLET